MAAIQEMISYLIGNGFRALANRARSSFGTIDGYVVLDLKGSYPERRPVARPLLIRLLARAKEDESIEGLTGRLDRIAGDPSVQGAVLRIGHLPVDFATADSIRTAVARFRAQGKRVVAYFTTDIDLRSYYVANSANEVAGPESAHFMVTGLNVQMQFLKDALARWGISGDFETMGEYKSAVEPIMRSDISEPNREMMESMLSSLWASVTDGIADRRGLSPGSVAALLDEAPFTLQRALEARLVDFVGYEDTLPEHLGRPGSPAKLVPWRTASLRLRKAWAHPAVGVVSIVSVKGAIVSGESRDIPSPVPFVGGTQAGSETVVRALRQAERDPRTKAIVCYVDSPGGSALASDIIWREVRRIDQHKPVVAAMGGVAASGGYYIAAGARHIVAHPQTLTGSIGVLGGKLVLRDLYQKAGIRSILFTRGRNAALFSGARPFESGEREAVRGMLSDTYERFKNRVSQGRKLDADAVELRAKGRVWTGQQALEQGLVDELGDLQTAIARAKRLAGLPATAKVRTADIAPHGAYAPPILDGARVITETVANLNRLNQESVWAIMPWMITAS